MSGPRSATAAAISRSTAGYAYFVVHKTGRIYRQSLGGGPARPITPAFGKAASPAVSPDGRWVVYVHHDDDDVDRLGIVDAEGTSAGRRSWPWAATSTCSRAGAPTDDSWRGSPGTIPNMPWDGTLLYVAAGPSQRRGRAATWRAGRGGRRAGGRGLPAGVHARRPPAPLRVRRERLGPDRTAATWTRGRAPLAHRRGRRVRRRRPGCKGMRTYAVSADGRLLAAARNDRGFLRLERIELATAARRRPSRRWPTTATSSRSPPAPEGDRVVLVGQRRDAAAADRRARLRRAARRGSSPGRPPSPFPPEALAECEAISWLSSDGDLAHGLYYAPASDRFEGAGKPPLVVLIHGGPTSQSRAGWNPQAQFFATRGYAVLLVNYRGSTGYGRAYMLKLRGNWGVCDVEDAASGVAPPGRRRAHRSRADRDHGRQRRRIHRAPGR